MIDTGVDKTTQTTSTRRHYTRGWAKTDLRSARDLLWNII